MKKTCLRIMAAMIMLAALLPAGFVTVYGAQTAEIDGITYTYKVVKKKTVTINAMVSDLDTLVITDKIDGRPVTEIKSEAMDCENVISITIPQTMVTVHAGAFYNCAKVVELSLPAGCDASRGFDGLTEMRHLYITGSGEMHDYASWYDVPYSLSHLTITQLSLADGITHIGSHSFEGLVSVTEFEFPKQLESIGENGCYNMLGITSWDLPSKLVRLDKGALGRDHFKQDRYVEMMLPETLTEIGEGALPRDVRYSAYKNTPAASWLQSSNIIFEEIKFELTASSHSMSVGDEYQLEFEGTPDYLKRRAVFTSSDDSVVRVTPDGHIWAYGPGKATVTATCSSAETSIVITVKDDSEYPSRLLRLPLDSVMMLDLNDFGYSTDDIWGLLYDEEILYIDEDYDITALQIGRSDLCIDTMGGTVRYIVDVYKEVGTVVPELDDFVMVRGREFRLPYHIEPGDASDTAVLLESDDESIVSVSNDGKLRAEGAGTVTVRLIPRDGSGHVSSVTVTVVDNEIDLPIYAIPIMLGKQFRLYFPKYPDFQFYSSDESVATVGPNGMITSNGMGSCFITMYREDHSGAATVDIRTYKAFANGIDVSEWQDTLTYNDWVSIKEYGIDFAIIRAGNGDYWKDVQFENNYEKAHEAGVDLGVYHYITATDTEQAVIEAREMLKWLEGKHFEYPVVIDIEGGDHQKLSKKNFSDIVDAYGTVLTEAGWKVAVYSYASLLDSKLNDTVLAKYDVWQAHWSTTRPTVFEKPYTMWQYTSDGTVWGIDGRCDMDISFFDYPSYMKNNHVNGY